MKRVIFLIVNVMLLYVIPINAQDLITFDNQGWNADQILDTNLTVDNCMLSSSRNFYTNYGYNFDVNNVSLYYAFQNTATDMITITKSGNQFFDFKSIAVYQVSEEGMDTLTIEGWNGPELKYSGSFLNNNIWQILNLDYTYINKAVIKTGHSSKGGLLDYNFDNISFNSVTGIDPADNLPKSFSLDQNYPNPFNPSTQISWQAPVSGWQTLKVYDILGNEVATLVDEQKEAGSYSVSFSGDDLASGLYIYRLSTAGFVSTKKMMLIK